MYSDKIMTSSLIVKIVLKISGGKKKKKEFSLLSFGVSDVFRFIRQIAERNTTAFETQ